MPDLLHGLALLVCLVGMGVMMWMMSRRHTRAPDPDLAAQRAVLAGLDAQIDRR